MSLTLREGWVGVAFGIGLAACGARSGLQIDEDTPDAGADPVWVECRIEGPSLAVVGEPVTLVVTTEGADPSVARWAVDGDPERSRIAPTVGSTTMFAASEPGIFTARAMVSAPEGTPAQCAVTLEIVESFGIDCGSSTRRGSVGEELLLAVEAVGEPLASVEWSVRTSPAGATTELEPVGLGANARFKGDQAGPYAVEARARSVTGTEGRCEVRVELGPPPSVVCPEERLLTTVGDRVPLRVEAAGAALVEWSLTDRPAGSRAAVSPAAGLETTITTDQPGTYRTRAVATDALGLTTVCETQILAQPRPPSLSCGDRRIVRPLEPTELSVEVSGAMGDPDISWSVMDRPRGSRAELAATDGPTVELTPDLAGLYRLRVEVADASGWRAECVVEVEARGLEGLRVEMFWDTDGSDMDLHLLHPDATEWYGELDCYFRNCQEPGGLPWGGPGPEDNPRLALDERFGFGPENTNIEVPEPGVYRVAVTAFDDDGQVEVRIYCSSAEPVAEFGPVWLEEVDAQFWRVADIEVLPSGGCRVSALGGGRPDIITENTARRER